jgi:hypothetical protein
MANAHPVTSGHAPFSTLCDIAETVNLHVELHVHNRRLHAITISRRKTPRRPIHRAYITTTVDAAALALLKLMAPKTTRG